MLICIVAAPVNRKAILDKTRCIRCKYVVHELIHFRWCVQFLFICYLNLLRQRPNNHIVRVLHAGAGLVTAIFVLEKNVVCPGHPVAVSIVEKTRRFTGTILRWLVARSRVKDDGRHRNLQQNLLFSRARSFVATLWNIAPN